MLSIITNPTIIAVVVMVALCLCKVNVFLSIIISSLVCGLLGGAGLTEAIEVFYKNMGNDNRMVLFLLLLGVLSVTMEYNGVGKVLAPRVAKLVGKKAWLFPVVLLLLAIISETFVLVGVSFLLVVVPPLFNLLNDYKIDRRLLVIATCCGLQIGYCCFPVGYGLGFMGIVQNALSENGLEVTINQIWQANLVLAVAMLLAVIAAMFVYKKRTYQRSEEAVAASDTAANTELPPIEWKHIACLLSGVAVVVVQVLTKSMPLAGLAMVAMLVITGAIRIKDFDRLLMKGMKDSVYVCLVLMAAVAFAAISKQFGQLESLIAGASSVVGSSKVFGAFFMLLLGLLITMGIGSSFSTVPIVATVLVPLGLSLSMSPAAIIMLVSAAGALGDSGAPSSNQTLISTNAFNADGQHDHIKDSCIPSFLFVNVAIMVVCTVAAIFM